MEKGYATDNIFKLNLEMKNLSNAYMLSSFNI